MTAFSKLVAVAMVMASFCNYVSAGGRLPSNNGQGAVKYQGQEGDPDYSKNWDSSFKYYSPDIPSQWDTYPSIGGSYLQDGNGVIYGADDN
jgi:hypothetical protein